jgi:hypothetical protein
VPALIILNVAMVAMVLAMADAPACRGTTTQKSAP